MVKRDTEPQLGIRRYQPTDRAAVRRIACDTADSGEPIENFFLDRELAADLLTAYYTDINPSSTWVAINDGDVVGYIAGCLDSKRYLQTMACRVFPWSLLRAFGRRKFWKAQTLRVFRSCVRTGGRCGTYRIRYLERFPAHLHINVQPGFRGKNAGKLLLHTFLEHAVENRARGIHVATREKNLAARFFFERHGFLLAERLSTYFPGKMGVEGSHLCVYVKSLP